ncbi:hypothetical protein GCM10009111_01100 [Colwellia asteriadis]|uniref:Uncharacterized protein n=1 Tax=Colwellia asteriadis TaxID=517723 RepID=A0ABP3WFX8_9GAMM
MLTKDPVNHTTPYFFANNNSFETPEPQEPTLHFAYLSRSQLCLLPKKLQRLLVDNQYGVLDKHQVTTYRYNPACQFWAKTKTWQKVTYNQFKQAEQGLAIYPKKIDNTPKYAGSTANNAITGNASLAQVTNSSHPASNVATPASNLSQAQTDFLQQRAEMLRHQYAQNQAQSPTEQSYSPTVNIYKPEINSTMLLKATHQVRQNFIYHVLQASENVEQLAQLYTGYKNANLIYDYNLGCSERNPAPTGTNLLVPSGWKLNIEGGSTNSRSVHIQWQGPTSGETTIQLEKKRPDELSFWQHYIVVEPGEYTVAVNASGAVDTSAFTIEEPTFAYEIELLDELGEPQANMGYNIRLRNGHVITGQLDQNGYANVSGPDFENAKVSFFELADHDWSVGNIT